MWCNSKQLWTGQSWQLAGGRAWLHGSLSVWLLASSLLDVDNWLVWFGYGSLQVFQGAPLLVIRRTFRMLLSSTRVKEFFFSCGCIDISCREARGTGRMHIRFPNSLLSTGRFHLCFSLSRRMEAKAAEIIGLSVRVICIVPDLFTHQSDEGGWNYTRKSLFTFGQFPGYFKMFFYIPSNLVGCSSSSSYIYFLFPFFFTKPFVDPSSSYMCFIFFFLSMSWWCCGSY